MELLVIPDEAVGAAVTMQECLQAVEESFVEYANGRTLMPHKVHLDIPETDGFLRVMPAAIPRLGYAGVKIYLDPSYNSVNSPSALLLLDVKKGAPVALLGSNRLSQLRTGAASGVATKYLARKDATSVGIFGSGPHARTQLVGSTFVRNVSKAKVYSPNAEHRQNFAAEMSAKLGIEVTPVETPEACAKSDIVSLATVSRTPALMKNHVVLGTHINTIGSSFPGRTEVDPEVFLGSKVVVDSMEQATRGLEGAELSGLLKKGLMTKSAIYAELGELVLGVKPGRTSDEEVTLYKNTGMALWDVACGSRVYEKAKRLKLGRYVEL